MNSIPENTNPVLSSNTEDNNLDLMGAVEAQLVSVVENLLDNGANVNYALRGVSVLAKAVHTGNLDLVSLVFKYKPDLQREGYRSLNHCIAKQKFEMASHLLNLGVDFHVIDHSYKYNKYLKHAIQDKNKDGVKFILSNGINLNEANNQYFLIETFLKDKILFNYLLENGGSIKKALLIYKEFNPLPQEQLEKQLQGLISLEEKEELNLTLEEVQKSKPLKL